MSDLGPTVQIAWLRLMFDSLYLEYLFHFLLPNVSFWLKFSMNLSLQTCGIKVGYGRPQGQAGGRDGTVAAGGACCS